MDRKDWLALIAVHSDSWLMAMAYFNAARLDAEGRRLLFNEINSRGTTIMVATHDRTLLESMNKRVVILSQGRIISDGNDESSLIRAGRLARAGVGVKPP